MAMALGIYNFFSLFYVKWNDKAEQPLVIGVYKEVFSEVLIKGKLICKKKHKFKEQLICV